MSTLRNSRIVRVHSDLVLGRIADETFAIGERNIWGCGAVTLIVGDNFDTIVLPNTDTAVRHKHTNFCQRIFRNEVTKDDLRVGCAKIDTDGFWRRHSKKRFIYGARGLLVLVVWKVKIWRKAMCLELILFIWCLRNWPESLGTLWNLCEITWQHSVIVFSAPFFLFRVNLFVGSDHVSILIMIEEQRTV